MKHSLLITVLLLAIAVCSPAQTQTSKKRAEVTELEKLRNEFIVATTDYIGSLKKLKTSYERGVIRAEERLVQSRSFYDQNLISMNQLEAEQREVEQAKKKVTEVDDRIANANKQIQELPTLADLEREYRKVKRAPRRAESCQNWTLTASRRETKRGITLTWKLVCAR